MPGCIEWVTERHEVCTRTEDQGYEECSRSEDRGYERCCDWVPCSWFCDIVVWVTNIVCVAWTWVSNVVCVAWTYVSTTFCVAWDLLTTIVNGVLVVIESVIGWVLSAIAFIFELIDAIPGLGTLFRWIRNGITYALGIIASVADIILGALGIRPEKIIRICTVILRDEDGNPVATKESVVDVLQLAANVYKRDANIRLIPLKAFKFFTGFNKEETVDTSWVQIDGNNSDSGLLDPPCNAAGEWWLPGSKFQLKVSTLCFFGAWRRVLGYGAPITVFIVRNTPDALGCGLGIVDYVTADTSTTSDSPRTVGHEIGHACTLWHTCVDDGDNNLMSACAPCEDCNCPERDTPTDDDCIPSIRDVPIIDDWQALILRTSKHCTYF